MVETKNTFFSKSPSINLTGCESELIHIPGKIQSHGFLIAVDRHSGNIRYVSDSITKFLEIDPLLLLNADIEDLASITKMNTGYISLRHLLAEGEDSDFENINPLKVKFKNIPFDLIIHPANKFMLFEFEPLEASGNKDYFNQVMGVSLAKILEAGTLQKTLHNAARQVKEITQYDRVMIYKFHEDDHGEVIAEEKNDVLEPFLGLHYPASDIPAQARELYKINLVRIIADVDSTPAALMVNDPNYFDQPLDLTHSTLRAVSPVHIEYLKNMGVKSSFSISIIIRDKLWGLIACHNHQPRFISYEARNSAKLIGKILSSSIEYREELGKKEELTVFDKSLKEIVITAGSDWNIAKSLTWNDNVLTLTNAKGAALLFENKLYIIGNAPAENDMNDLIGWIKINDFSSLFHVDKLSNVFPPAQSYKDVASGILILTISKEMHEYIIWFKPEIIKTIKWAGNPDKPMERDGDGIYKLSPRRSFHEWVQKVEESSEPWSKGEIFSAMKAREEIVFLVNQKANQVRRLNEELQKAYKELDTFSYTISHDLSTPLATIKGYTQLLLEDYIEMPSDIKNILEKVIKNADHMNLLIKAVLAYSRLERDGLKVVKVNMQTLIEEIKNDLVMAYNTTGIEIEVYDTPALIGDEIMIYQVFANLAGNAVKYSTRAKNPKVIIKGEEKENEIIYTIQDNGVGIDMNSGNQIFDLFKRMENAGDFEGTGIGLAIVKKIMEKHNGKIWYHSELGKGTTFFLAFNKSLS